MKVIYLILILFTQIYTKINILKNYTSKKNERRLNQNEFDSLDMADRIKIEGLKQKLDNLIGKVLNLSKTMKIKFETLDTFTVSKIDELNDNLKEFKKKKIERELGIKLKDLQNKGETNNLEEKK